MPTRPLKDRAAILKAEINGHFAHGNKHRLKTTEALEIMARCGGEAGAAPSYFAIPAGSHDLRQADRVVGLVLLSCIASAALACRASRGQR